MATFRKRLGEQDLDGLQTSSNRRRVWGYTQRFAVDEFSVYEIPRLAIAWVRECQTDLTDQVRVALQHARNILPESQFGVGRRR